MLRSQGCWSTLSTPRYEDIPLRYEDDGYYEQQQALRKRWGNAQGPPSSAVNPSAAMQAMEDVERLEEEAAEYATLLLKALAPSR